jgi:four helix bundle protein
MQNLKVFDLKERTMRFSLQIIQFLESLPEGYTVQTLGRQLLRSATSIGANIIEAQAASSRKDFVNFYNIALKSANESKYWLALLKNSKKADAFDIEKFEGESDELARILAKCILTLKNRG